MQDSRYLETIEMLAATIAHEVKSPLSLIQANVDFLELCDEEKKFSKNYDIIKQELKRTDELLVNFIGLISIIYKFDEDIAIYDVVMHVVESYRRSVGKRITFKMRCPNKNLYVNGNFQLFTMAVSNTIKNAIESIEGEGMIEISIAAEQNVAKLTIKDSGNGITEEGLRHINMQEVYTTKPYGSGIGINICKNILTEHNGTYNIENDKNGSGCIVTITVPTAS